MMNKHVVELKDKKERPVTVTVNPDNTYTVKGGFSESIILSGPEFYHYSTECIGLSPTDFVRHFDYLPTTVGRTILYPSRHKLHVKRVLKTVYGILLHHGLTHLLNTPLYFYGDVSNVIRGDYLRHQASGKTAIVVQMSTHKIMTDVVLHEMGHEFYHRHFSDLEKDQIAQEYSRHEKIITPIVDGTITLRGAGESYDGIIFTVKGMNGSKVVLECEGINVEISQDWFRFLNVFKEQDGSFIYQPYVVDTFFPSKYSTANPSEWWAELFACVLMGKVTGEPAAFVHDMIAHHKK